MTDSLDKIIDRAFRNEEGGLSWQGVGELVRQADGLNSWDDRYPNLSSFVAEVAKRQGIAKGQDIAKRKRNAENAVWRAYSALRAFDEMSQDYAGFGIPLPMTAHDLAEKVTFETVELLERLRRAAPREVFTRVAKDALDGGISRKVLRDEVKAYMPALEGDTARGRGRHRPERPHGAVLEQDIAAALAKDGAKLLSAPSKKKFRFFAEGAGHRPDFVCLFQPEGSDVQIHGIEVKTLIHAEALKRLCHQLAVIRETFDAVWLATIETSYVLEQSSEVSGLGIITYKDGKLEVRRRPEISGDPNAKKEALLRRLYFERPMI